MEQQLQDALLDERNSEQHIDAVLDALQDVLVEDLLQTSEAPSIEGSVRRVVPLRRTNPTGQSDTDHT
jgi:hypothetical protein